MLANAGSGSPPTGHAGMHSYAWMAWVSMVMVIALTTTNPLYLVLVLLCVILVGVIAPRDGVGTAGLRAMAIFGVIMLLLAVLVATINGNYGSHIVFTVPGPRFPWWLGGLRLGGPVTAEAFVGSLIRALSAFCVFLAFAVFSASISVQKLVRAAPVAVFHLGLIITIGLTLLPASIEDLRRIREMQALRGSPSRLRQLPGLVVPAVIGGLERSMRLAEAMEARGVASQPQRATKAMRAGALLPAPLILAGMWLWFYAENWRLVAALLFAAAAGSLVVWARAANRQGVRTRFRDEPISLLDRAVSGFSLAIAAFVFSARQLGWLGLNYNPFADLPAPEFSAIAGGLILTCAWPAVRLLAHAPVPSVRPATGEEAEPAWR